MVTTKIYSAGAIAVLLVVLLAIGCADSDAPRPTKVFIPEGYVGWVRVEYNVKGASPFPKDIFGPWQYQHFSNAGIHTTSSPLHTNGGATVEYYFDSGTAQRPIPDGMVHGGITSFMVYKPDGTHVDGEFETYFVGSAGEFEKHKGELMARKISDFRYIADTPIFLPPTGIVADAR